MVRKLASVALLSLVSGLAVGRAVPRRRRHVELHAGLRRDHHAAALRRRESSAEK
jgi:hypothetical protein